MWLVRVDQAGSQEIKYAPIHELFVGVCQLLEGIDDDLSALTIDARVVVCGEE